MSEKIVEIDGKRYKKVQKGKYYDKKKTRKMKRHHPVRWILISAFCLLIVAPVGFVFGAFYVPKSNKKLPDTYDSFSANLTNTIGKSLTKLSKDNKKFEMSFDNDFLNSSLAYVKKTLIGSSSANNYIDSMYCDIKDNTYNFVLEVHASFFQTRITLSTNLEIDDNNFTFKINNVVLGRLPLGGLAKSLLPKFIKADDINAALKNAHFNATFDLNNLSIVYPRSNFTVDMGEILKAFNSSDTTSPVGALSNLILSLYSTIKETPKFDNGITFTLNFEKIGNYIINPTMKRTDINDTSYLDEFNNRVSFVESCLDKGIVSAKTSLDGENDKGCDTLLKYLLEGYDATKYATLFEGNTELQSAVTAKYTQFTSYTDYYGILKQNATKYKDFICTNIVETLKNPAGTKYANNNKLIDVNSAQTNIVNFLTNNTPIDFGMVGEDLLSDYFRSLILTSFNFCIPIKVDNKYKLPVIIFHDFSCNIDTTNGLTLIGDLYIQDVKIPFSIKTTVSTDPNSNRKVTITPSGYYLGDKELTDVGEYLLSFLSKAFPAPSATSIFGYDSTNKQFVFDFSQLDVDTSSTIPDIIKTSITSLLKGTGTISDGTRTLEASKTKLQCTCVSASGTDCGRLKFEIVKNS